jgi:hypothetical protein
MEEGGDHTVHTAHFGMAPSSQMALKKEAMTLFTDHFGMDSLLHHLFFSKLSFLLHVRLTGDKGDKNISLFSFTILSYIFYFLIFFFMIIEIRMSFCHLVT